MDILSDCAGIGVEELIVKGHDSFITTNMIESKSGVLPRISHVMVRIFRIGVVRHITRMLPTYSYLYLPIAGSLMEALVRLFTGLRNELRDTDALGSKELSLLDTS